MSVWLYHSSFHHKVEQLEVSKVSSVTLKQKSELKQVDLQQQAFHKKTYSHL